MVVFWCVNTQVRTHVRHRPSRAGGLVLEASVKRGAIVNCCYEKAKLGRSTAAVGASPSRWIAHRKCPEPPFCDPTSPPPRCHPRAKRRGRVPDPGDTGYASHFGRVSPLSLTNASDPSEASRSPGSMASE